jgi:hypothetical protein
MLSVDKILVGKSERKSLLEDLGVDGKIKCELKEIGYEGGDQFM